MSADPVAFARCDNCGCTVAPSDKPPRTPGSGCVVKMRDDGTTGIFANVRCPDCFGPVEAPTPDGVAPSEMWGADPPLIYEQPAEPDGKIRVSVRGFELEFYGREIGGAL